MNPVRLNPLQYQTIPSDVFPLNFRQGHYSFAQFHPFPILLPRNQNGVNHRMAPFVEIYAFVLEVRRRDYPLVVERVFFVVGVAKIAVGELKVEKVEAVFVLLNFRGSRIVFELRLSVYCAIRLGCEGEEERGRNQSIYSLNRGRGRELAQFLRRIQRWTMNGGGLRKPISAQSPINIAQGKHDIDASGHRESVEWCSLLRGVHTNEME
jgi:hypothetical protein